MYAFFHSGTWEKALMSEVRVERASVSANRTDLRILKVSFGEGKG